MDGRGGWKGRWNKGEEKGREISPPRPLLKVGAYANITPANSCNLTTFDFVCMYI